jgi:AcrR family transcriptional regulator
MATSTTSELTPRAREIVGAARALLESEGADALSMRNLADRLGIRAPSIYKHFPNKEALEAAMISDGFEEQAELFEAALEPPGEPLLRMTEAYRAYAKAHPHLYRLINDRSLNRELVRPGVEERAAAPVVQASGGDEDLGRAIWAFAHGMTILELNDRFPPGADLDAAWQRGIEALRSGVTLRSGRVG